jgi:glyoxylase-like metal-dependent hydrolase (beta-lactamase superfamily II)
VILTLLLAQHVAGPVDVDAVDTSVAPAAEAVRKSSGVAPDRVFSGPETHFDRLEVMPLPGHTPGSTSYLYRSPHGRTYLFTGDTIGRNDRGVWTAGYLPFSDKAMLIATLRRLAELQPDVVLSSAFAGAHPHAEVTPAEWRAAVDQALAPLLEEAPA